jgi:hypothetical protein
MKSTVKNSLVLIMVFCILTVTGCFNSYRSTLDLLFKMKIGSGENELGLLSPDGIFYSDSLNIHYQNGFYYLSDAINQKIMKVTEKGEPVLIIYNRDYNPSIVTTDNSNDSEQTQSVFVKLYKEFNLIKPGKITADIEKNIFVVNGTSSYYKDNLSGTINSQSVIKFNSHGDPLFELGQNGISTVPFGYIVDMITDEAGNLIIYENYQDGAIIYQFTTDGILLKKVKISRNMIPLNTKENNYIIDIVNIKPGYIRNDIYVTCQFIKEIKETAGNIRYETLYEKILRFNLETEKFDRLLLRLNPQTADISKIIENNTELQNLYGGKNKIVRPFESLLGIDSSHNIYLSQKDLIYSVFNVNNQILLIYNSYGRVINQISAAFDKEIQFVSGMYFTSSGMVYSYYVKNGEIYFVIIN